MFIITKITISGTLGSGKSTVLALLCERLGYKKYSNGVFMRRLAHERGLSLMNFSKLAEQDHSIDKTLDDFQVKLGLEEDNFILESRLGYHFIPDSIKIFLKANLDVAALRVHDALLKGDSSREKEGLVNDVEQIKKDLVTRSESEHSRYLKSYGLNYEDESNYDLVIDTSSISPGQVVDKILDFLKNN